MSTQNWTCNSLSPHPSQHLPILPSVPQNKGMAFCQLSGDLAGAATCCRPMETPGHPPGLLGLTQLVRPLIAMEIGWAVLLCSSPHPA